MHKCEHPPDRVTADILEGDVDGQAVQWCQLCGACRRLFRNGLGMRPGDWREPEFVMLPDTCRQKG